MTGWAHRSQEQLELYALDRLSGAEEVDTEEHLLVCEPCRLQLEEAGEFAFALQDALRQQALTTRSRAPGRWLDYLGFAGFAWKPQLALGGALAGLVLATGLYLTGNHTKFVPLASLNLTAIRGGIPSIRAARETDLVLGDVVAQTGATADSGRVELVSETGAPVWRGNPAANLSPGHPVTVRVTQPLRPGVYFARFYLSSGKLIHEYGFQVTE